MIFEIANPKFLIRTFDTPKNLQLPNVIFDKIEFDPTIDYGKKPALLAFRKAQQNIVAISRRRKAKFYNLAG